MHRTATPSQFFSLSKSALCEEFVGKSLDVLRTPAFVVDRHIFAQNCAKMHINAKDWGASFRAHLKTHKTVEGTRLQLISSVDKTQSIVVSTLMEAWQVVAAGLVKDDVVKDILYGLPIAANKIADLSDLWDTVNKDGGIVRVLIDHPKQIQMLEEFESQREKPRKWSVFVKIDGGQKRAGVPPDSPYFEPLIHTLFNSPVVDVYGFYAHASNGYASKSFSEASLVLSMEVDAVNTAAGQALAILSKSQITAPTHPFVLSVGSTPTAHAANATTRAKLSTILHGTLELHAGNYPMLDLQQHETGMIDLNSVAHRVRATVISLYPRRGVDGSDEALIDAGAIAFSKDTGPSSGYGDVVSLRGLARGGWKVGRISQEHGILTGGKDQLELGEIVEIIGQHACLIAAAYPWYYIVDRSVDQGQTVVDIWVPWKGW